MKKFTTELTDDCRDAGGRATQGAVAEITEQRIKAADPNLKIQSCSTSALPASFASEVSQSVALTG
jgi:hypothetical protein